MFLDSKDNAVYRLKKDSLVLWIAPESVPSIGATYIVKNDTIFRYGGKKGFMNIDYWSFLRHKSLGILILHLKVLTLLMGPLIIVM